MVERPCGAVTERHAKERTWVGVGKDVSDQLRRRSPPMQVARNFGVSSDKRHRYAAASLRAEIVARTSAWCAREGMDDSVLSGLAQVLSDVRSLHVLRSLAHESEPEVLAAWWWTRPGRKGGSSALLRALFLWRVGTDQRAEMARGQATRGAKDAAEWPPMARTL